MVNLRNVKRETLDPIIELSSESEGETPSLPSQLPNLNEPAPFVATQPTVRTPANSPSSSSFSLPPLYPSSSQDCPSVMQCLRKLSSVPGSRTELAQIDFDRIEYHKVQFLPSQFDGDVVFELPPICGRVHSSGARSMEGMDKRYDGHTWCRTTTSNIHNTFGLKFRRSTCVGHLRCDNEDCDYLARTSKKNETEWTGTTNFPFDVRQSPPPDSSIVCKVCKKAPSCRDSCTARVYYVLNVNDRSRACIHLGYHRHPVAEGQCRESMETITGLIASEVAKTPTAKNSAIALAASKEFLETFLVHSGPGPKEMLRRTGIGQGDGQVSHAQLSERSEHDRHLPRTRQRQRRD